MQGPFAYRKDISKLLGASLNWAQRYSGPILVIVTIVLGTIGYELCENVGGGLEPLYKALQHFALAYDYDCAPTDHALLNISRFMAAILLAYAVIRLLFSQVWASVKLRSQALFRKSDRHVLIGYGAVNQEIARERVDKGVPVTIVARSFDGAAREYASTHRIVLIERDIRDEAALRGLNLKRAHKIIIACGDDSLTMETAQRVGKLVDGTDALIYAHFTSTENYRQLQLTSDAGLGIERRFAGFSVREETARFLFARTWLAERASRTPNLDGGGKPRLHVVVVGAGDLGMAMTRAALAHGCSAGLGRPTVTVIDREKDGGKARFRAAMGNVQDKTIPIDDRPDVRFKSCHAEGLCDELLDTDIPVTAWIICCRDDATNLELAMRLEGEMQRGLRPPAPIYPRQWQGNVRDQDVGDDTTAPLATRIGQADPWHLVAPFGGMQDVVPTLSILDDDGMTLPKAIHAQYLQSVSDSFEASELPAIIDEFGAPPWADGQGPPNPAERTRLTKAYVIENKRFSDQWPDLDDEGRMSNIASAEQAAVRLWELGYDWKHRYGGQLPGVNQLEIAQKFAAADAQDLSPTTLIGGVCEAEHRRWMVERALRGWSAAKRGERSNAMRLHPDFRPYINLYEEAKADVADTTTPIEDANLRRLDAAALRGITSALAMTGADTKARFTQDPEPISLLCVPELYPHNYRLILDVPLFDKKDKNVAAKLAPNLERIKAWAHFDSAFSIRLRPATPDVWTSAALKSALRNLHHDISGHGVHIFVDHLDGHDIRSQIKRDEDTTDL